MLCRRQHLPKICTMFCLVLNIVLVLYIIAYSSCSERQRNQFPLSASEFVYPVSLVCCCCCCSVPQLNTQSVTRYVHPHLYMYKCRYTTQGERIACATVFYYPAHGGSRTHFVFGGSFVSLTLRLFLQYAYIQSLCVWLGKLRFSFF